MDTYNLARCIFRAVIAEFTDEIYSGKDNTSAALDPEGNLHFALCDGRNLKVEIKLDPPK